MNTAVNSAEKQISPVRMMFVSGIGLLFDSLDVGILSFVVVVLTKLWHLSPTQAGLLGSMNLIGMAIGAAMAGMLADRFGRKRVFLWTLLIYSVATGASALASGIGVLLVIRFFVGWGLGGELPVATAYVLESSPEHLKARRVVLLESFWALGSLVAAILSFFVIPNISWRVAFLIGAIPALYAIILRRELPETPLYKKFGKKGDVWGKFASLWTNGNARTTIVVWILWFSILFAYYGMFFWLPSIMFDKGFPVVKSFGYVLLMTIAQFPGYMTAAYLIEKWGRKTVLVIFMILSAIFALLFGFAESSTMLFVAGIGLNFFNLGAIGSMYALAVESYPTVYRGTGMGWSMGFGRIGGLIAPYLVGYWKGIYSYGTIFTIFFATTLVAAIIALIWAKETKGLTASK
jgi:MFS transporter, putative metabolite:H+ symporter